MIILRKICCLLKLLNFAGFVICCISSVGLQTACFAVHQNQVQYDELSRTTLVKILHGYCLDPYPHHFKKHYPNLQLSIYLLFCAASTEIISGNFVFFLGQMVLAL